MSDEIADPQGEPSFGAAEEVTIMADALVETLKSEGYQPAAIMTILLTAYATFLAREGIKLGRPLDEAFNACDEQIECVKMILAVEYGAADLAQSHVH